LDDHRAHAHQGRLRVFTFHWAFLVFSVDPFVTP
jgi:hypothetical protein